MRITRERYLDDSTRWHLTIELLTRTGAMHSALDRLAPGQREAISDALVEALGRIAAIVQPALVAGKEGGPEGPPGGS